MNPPSRRRVSHQAYSPTPKTNPPATAHKLDQTKPHNLFFRTIPPLTRPFPVNSLIWSSRVFSSTGHLPRMNVIVICSDTFRYDHLGFLNRHNVFTPNLDKLAAESASFADFWLCSFPTLVNRIEVFTGRCTFPFFHCGPLPYEYPVLSEVFRRHGFSTALMADNLHLMKPGWRFGRGFDLVKDTPGQVHDDFQPAFAPMIALPCPAEKLAPPRNRLDQYRRNAWWYRNHHTSTTANLFQDAIRYLESPPEKFFLWIDAFDPHEPWDAPDEFRKLY